MHMHSGAKRKTQKNVRCNSVTRISRGRNHYILGHGWSNLGTKIKDLYERLS